MVQSERAARPYGILTFETAEECLECAEAIAGWTWKEGQELRWLTVRYIDIR